MEDLSNFIQSVGAMAEMTAITAKMLGEVIRPNGSTKKEDEQ